MTTPFSIKYLKKESSFELQLEPFSLHDVLSTFDVNQYVRVDLLHLFQSPEAKIGDFDYNEDFLAGMELTLETLLSFLDSIGEYEIFNMAFEIEDGTYFNIEEGILKIIVANDEEHKILDLISAENSHFDSDTYNKLKQNEGRFVYLNKTTKYNVISNNELWNKFEIAVN